MNVQHAPTARTESRERHSSPRLQGRWLLLARVGWVALVVLTLAIFFASLPAYLALLQTLCTGPACANEALLTPEQEGVLKGMGLSLGTYAAYTVALTLASVVVCLVVSTLIAWRRSDDRMAMLVALMLVTFGPISATSTVRVIPFLWQVPNACLYFLALALLVLVFLLFPTGQFMPRWTRWTLVVFLTVLLPFTFLPNEPFMQNTLALSLLDLTYLGEFAIIAVVQLYRYRRVSSPLQRQQTKWVVYGLAVLCTVIVVGVVLLIVPALSSPSSLYPSLALVVVGDFLLLLIPLSFGFAMLRYRLWDIDILIRRTLVYGTLTAILTLVYVGLVIGLQALLRGIISQDNSVAIVISTLAIAALFQPLRRGIQRLIDRRFYRNKYDAAKTLAAFSATLRQEVDLDQLREQLLAVVQETMQPAHVSLWLRPPAPNRKQQTVWSSTSPVPPSSGDNG
jgi:fumarate reductase subunit D